MTTLTSLLDDLRDIRSHLDWAEGETAPDLERVDPGNAERARNLVHYVALRKHELTTLQDRLASVGLSTFTRVDADVALSLDVAIETLAALVEHRDRGPGCDVPMPGTLELRRRRSDLFGPSAPGRTTRIMVTLPSEAAEYPAVIGDYRRAGMDLARINCAHDDAEAWTTMAASARAVGARVAMDLGGPKVRTGPLEPGPKVLKIRPTRDASGVVVHPAAVLLVDLDAIDASGGEAPFASHATQGHVPVRGLDAARLAEGDELRLFDARGSRRRLTVTQVAPFFVMVEAKRTTYFRTGDAIETPGEHELRIGELPEIPSFHTVSLGDTIVLTRSLEPQPATARGTHAIGCTLGAVIDDARVGHRVFFDDGKLEGRVIERRPDELVIEITRSRPGGVKLRAEKGINVPDTDLRIPALTDDDLAALPVVAKHADLVNFSFVRTPDDVFALIDRLRDHGAYDVGIVLKIETRQSYVALPQLLVAAMRWPRVGVMIARGDLAVELGFEQLAEVQEEILRLCEAGRVPVIWATQVLDSLARTGLPSRAEVTDAAMGRRAEAVMLNKGPFIAQAIGALDDILQRMGDVMSKQRIHLPAIEEWTLDPVEDA